MKTEGNLTSSLAYSSALLGLAIYDVKAEVQLQQIRWCRPKKAGARVGARSHTQNAALPSLVKNSLKHFCLLVGAVNAPLYHMYLLWYKIIILI